MNGRYRNITASILQIKVEFSFHYFMLKHFWGVPVIMIISNAFCKWTDKPVKGFKTVKDTSGVMFYHSPSVFNYYLMPLVVFWQLQLLHQNSCTFILLNSYNPVLGGSSANKILYFETGWPLIDTGTRTRFSIVGDSLKWFTNTKVDL